MKTLMKASALLALVALCRVSAAQSSPPPLRIEVRALDTANAPVPARTSP